MSLIPKTLQNDLKPIRGNYPMAILLRHAERTPIDLDDYTKKVILTKTGILSSIELGKFLVKYHITKIFSSPIHRCVETAKKILKGADLINKSIIRENLLGDPGCFVINANLASQQFRKSGTIGTILNFIHKKKLPGFCELSIGASNLLSLLIQNLPKQDNSLNIFVSHDAIIMPFISNYIKWEFSKQSWHHYLEGLLIFKKKNRIYIKYKGIIQEIKRMN